MAPKGLVAFDLDGTLLDREGRFLPDASRVIAALKDAGYKLAVNTGRLGAGFALEAARRLDEKGLHLFSDGALIADALGRPERLYPFSEEATRRLYRVLKARPLPADIITESRVRLYLPESPPAYLEWHVERTGTPAFPAPPEAVLRSPPLVVWLAGVPEPDWAEVERELDGLFHTELHGPYEGKLFVGLKSKDRNKGTGLLELAELYGIPRERTVMVGDGVNDLSALEVAGLGIAVKGGSEAAQAAADQVVASPEEGGLFELLDAIRSRLG